MVRCLLEVFEGEFRREVDAEVDVRREDGCIGLSDQPESLRAISVSSSVGVGMISFSEMIGESVFRSRSSMSVESRVCRTFAVTTFEGGVLGTSDLERRCCFLSITTMSPIGNAISTAIND